MEDSQWELVFVHRYLCWHIVTHQVEVMSNGLEEGLRCRCPLLLLKLWKNGNTVKRRFRIGKSRYRFLILMHPFYSMTLSVKINNPSLEERSDFGIPSCQPCGMIREGHFSLQRERQNEVGIWRQHFLKASFDVSLSVHHTEYFKSYFKTPVSLYLMVKNLTPLHMFMNCSHGDLCSNF